MGMLRLLEDEVMELNIVERASDNTIGLDAENVQPHLQERWVIPPMPTPPSSPPWRTCLRCTRARMIQISPWSVPGRDLKATDCRNPSAEFPVKPGHPRA